jgi:hypothetical protein
MQKKPLYRKVNTRARGVHHNFGGQYRHQRNTKADVQSELKSGSMHGKHRRGLDYTPLFKFLLSKIGKRWDDVFSEAVSRLDKSEPIYWLVARSELEQRDYVCIGEATYFSGLYIDHAGLLQIVNPTLRAEDMQPHCTCCTHTFNGTRFPVEASVPHGAV